jgi:NAD(P)-dependent dehydrogenase (short-subunit alcohol dehydrogenase family)
VTGASSASRFSLEGKVAVVTGGLGLLGRQHALALAEAGANVAVADLDRQAADQFAGELTRRFGGRACGCHTDITDAGAVAALCDDAQRALGPIDILVNNAAIDDKFSSGAHDETAAFERYPLERWKAMLETNVTGTFLCCQIIGRGMADRAAGSIINIASTYGVVAPDQALYRNADGTQPFFKGPAYPTTKGAVIALTRFLAAYWGNRGVRVNALSPGGVDTGQDPGFVARYCARTPLGRMATPTDYQGALVFLASDASSYMTGANLVVDGGWTAW